MLVTINKNRGLILMVITVFAVFSWMILEMAGDSREAFLREHGQVHPSEYERTWTISVVNTESGKK